MRLTFPDGTVCATRPAPVLGPSAPPSRFPPALQDATLPPSLSPSLLHPRHWLLKFGAEKGRNLFERRHGMMEKGTVRSNTWDPT